MNKLTAKEKNVLIDRGTEAPFTGRYDDFFEDGTFICRQCNTPLFSSRAKFDAGCGWPSFDENFPDTVTRLPDPDGSRTEIECTNCKAHLGHVFAGEGMTDKNTRHCVNSISLRFIPRGKVIPKTLRE